MEKNSEKKFFAFFKNIPFNLLDDPCMYINDAKKSKKQRSLKLKTEGISRIIYPQWIQSNFRLSKYDYKKNFFIFVHSKDVWFLNWNVTYCCDADKRKTLGTQKGW